MERIEARASVADVSRRLAAEGLLIGTAGNVSVALDGADAGLVAVTATGVVLAEATPDEVTVVDRDGTVFEGRLAPTSELRLHLDLLARPDVTAVCTPTPCLDSTLAGARRGARRALPAAHARGSVRRAVRGLAPRARGLRRRGPAHRRAALLANHGTVSIGHDLPAAVEAALLLEWICTLHWRASTLGTPRVLSEADQRAVIEFALRSGYGTPHRIDEDDS
jgi:L-fuculose-phosphate aldolase